MSELKLKSLRVQNFRVFRDLQIDRLGRVNLIVGKNNVGKTTLLEAIDLYVNGGRSIVVGQLLRKRDLKKIDKVRGVDKSFYGVKISANRHLFHGHPDLRQVSQKDDALPDVPEIRIESKPRTNKDLIFRLELNPKDSEIYLAPEVGEKGSSVTALGERAVSIFVGEHDSMSINEGEAWDQIELTDREKAVLKALRIIAPGLESVRMRSYKTEPNGEERRVPVAKIESAAEPEPLRSLGAGMNRLFRLALSLASAGDGVLLIDEIENGLHYSIQPDMWRLIFEMANTLNVQVFATTHSHDCVKAFDRVANDYEDEEGMLIQLRQRRSDPEEIAAVTADEEELESALYTGIDPR